MRERAARTRRKPGGGKRREPLDARRRTCQIASFTPRVTKHGFAVSLGVRHFFWSEQGPLPWFSRITRHETRITAFYRVLRPSGGETCRLGSAGKKGSEALQFFLRPGRPGMRTEEPFLMSRDARSVAQTKAAKARFTGPPALPGRSTASPANGFSRNTNHESRLFMLFPWLVWCPLVLKPFSLVFSAPAC